MGITIRIYSIIILSLILVFALIHLGVGVSIVVINNDFGDMLSREKILAASNIAISGVGIIVSALGLFSVLTNQKILSKFRFILRRPTYFTYIDISILLLYVSFF